MSSEQSVQCKDVAVDIGGYEADLTPLVTKQSERYAEWISNNIGDGLFKRDVRHALGAYLEQHPDRDHQNTPLWTGTRGWLSNRSSIVRLLDKYAYLAGIELIRPHSLRHTFSSRYLEANPGDLRGLAALLGHANLNTVMIYTEPRIEDLAERMERVEARGA